MSPPAATARRVVPAARLRGRLEMPADKSIGHRALILGALSGGPTTVGLRTPGDDLRSTISCLRALGVEVEEDGDASWTVRGEIVRDASADCGNSGTTMRLLAGAVAGLPRRITLDGDASLRARPMERVAALLREAGATVTTTDGHAPIVVEGTATPRAVSHRLPVASAQLLGAALFAGLRAAGATRVDSPGPTRDHTERMLAWLGVPVRREGLATTLTGPARPRPFTLRVPGDPSAAAAWLVAAALHPDAEITIAGVGINPTRLALVEVLRRMGADVEVRASADHRPEPVGDLVVRSAGALRGVRVAAGEAAELIDELPLLAVAMAGAEDESEVRGADELRVKESDRIGAVVAALRAIGADADELPDGWRVRRGGPSSGRVATHGDHRIAMAFAVAGLTGVADTVELDDPACTSVSYPSFWDDLAAVSA